MLAVAPLNAAHAPFPAHILLLLVIFRAAEFLGKPFMGPPSVPHVNEDFFRVYFLGAHVSFVSF